MIQLVDLAYKYYTLWQCTNAIENGSRIEFSTKSRPCERVLNEISVDTMARDLKMEKIAALRFPNGLSSKERIACNLNEIARLYYKEPSLDEIWSFLLHCTEEQQTDFICTMMSYFHMSHSRFLTIASETEEEILRDQIALLCRGEHHLEYVGAYLKKYAIEFFSQNLTFSEGKVDECWKGPLSFFLATLTSAERGNIEKIINNIKEK